MNVSVSKWHRWAVVVLKHFKNQSCLRELDHNLDTKWFRIRYQLHLNDLLTLGPYNRRSVSESILLGYRPRGMAWSIVDPCGPRETRGVERKGNMLSDRSLPKWDVVWSPGPVAPPEIARTSMIQLYSRTVNFFDQSSPVVERLATARIDSDRQSSLAEKTEVLSVALRPNSSNLIGTLKLARFGVSFKIPHQMRRCVWLILLQIPNSEWFNSWIGTSFDAFRGNIFCTWISEV